MLEGTMPSSIILVGLLVGNNYFLSAFHSLFFSFFFDFFLFLPTIFHHMSPCANRWRKIKFLILFGSIPDVKSPMSSELIWCLLFTKLSSNSQFIFFVLHLISLEMPYGHGCTSF